MTRHALSLTLAVFFCLVPATQAQITAPVHADTDLLLGFDVGEATVQSLDLPLEPERSFSVQVMVDGSSKVLNLWPHSIRSPHSFEVLAQVESGDLVPVSVGAPKTLRGVVDGYPESIITGSLTGGSLTAIIRLAPGASLWTIQPARDVDPLAPAASHVVFDSGDTLPIDAVCGLRTTRADDHSTPPEQAYAGGVIKVCEIAVDADVEFYNKNSSSVNQTENDIENVLNSVEGIYDSDVGILYEITTVIVRTSEPDPYSTTSSGTLLNQFQSHWNSSQGSVPRDTAHLFTGKNINGGTIGIAYLNVICNLGSAYGLSESKFTNNFTSRVGLTAHELGHNWNAGHCDGASDCKIMCSGLGGCAGNLNSFGNNSKNSITNKKNNSNCLSDPPASAAPVLSNINPSSVPTLEPGSVTLTGANFSGAQLVDLGVATLGSGQFAVESDSQITFTAPAPISLGTTGVTVTNSVGTSNSLPFSYVANDPPGMSVSPFGLTGMDTTWTYGSDAGDIGYLIMSLDSSTFNFHGDPVLLNFVIVTFGVMDGAGLASVTATIPASLSGLTIFSEAVMFAGSYQGSTNIASTWIVF